MSPLLFILVAASLNATIEKAKEAMWIKGLVVIKKIFYKFTNVDDTIIFGQPNIKEAVK